MLGDRWKERSIERLSAALCTVFEILFSDIFFAAITPIRYIGRTTTERS